MPLSKVVLLSFITLVTMVNPLAVIPSFVALTDGVSRAGRARMALSDVQKADIDPASIAVVPLAIPMLSGPGAITSTMVLVNLYPRIEQKVAVIVAIAAVGVTSWLVLLSAGSPS